MKYIIDLPDNCSWVQWVMTSDKDGHAYFDFKSPEDLTTLDKELSEAYQKGFEAGSHEATTLEYQQGLDDAWETITKIAKMPDGERGKVFGEAWISNILNKFSISEIINILDGYEHEQDEIKVGDEVIPIDAIRRPFVVVSIENNVINGFELTDGFMTRGCHRDETRWEKTGRHFPQVEELLNAMKEGAE